MESNLHRTVFTLSFVLVTASPHQISDLERSEIINSWKPSALVRLSVPWVGTAWTLAAAMECSLLVPTRLAPTQLHIPVPHLDEGHRDSPFMPASPVSKHMAVEHLEKARELAGRVGTWADGMGIPPPE